jgi:hypothetical protein
MTNTSHKQDNGYTQITKIINQEVNHGHFIGIDLHSNNSYISIIDKENGCGSEPKFLADIKPKFVIGRLSHP